MATLTSTVSDNLALNEVALSVHPHVTLAAENQAFQESLARLANASRVALDNLGLQESIPRLANASRTLSDNLGLQEAISRILVISALISDNLAIQEAILAVNQPAPPVPVTTQAESSGDRGLASTAKYSYEMSIRFSLSGSADVEFKEASLAKPVKKQKRKMTRLEWLRMQDEKWLEEMILN
jgi:hypothetical protein